MSASDHGIFTNLRGSECACGGEKRAGKSFCKRDYFRLEKADRDALYNREGYAETYRRCLRLLGLTEPQA